MATAVQSPLSSRSALFSTQPYERENVPSRVRYLQIYNLLSAFGWLCVLGRVLLLVPLVGFENVHGGVGTWLRWTQTAAGLEVLHSLSGRHRISASFTSCHYRSAWFG